MLYKGRQTLRIYVHLVSDHDVFQLLFVITCSRLCEMPLIKGVSFLICISDIEE